MNYKNDGKSLQWTASLSETTKMCGFVCPGRRKQCVPRIQVGRSFNVWGSAYTLQKETQDDRNDRGNRVTSRKPLDSQRHHIWVCLKMGYTPNYSHLVGIMISKTIGFKATLFSDKPHISARHIRDMSWSQCLHLRYLSCRWKRRGVSKSVHHQFEITWGVN